MPVRLLHQPIFIEPVRLADEPLEPVAVHCPLEGALAHADEDLGRCGGWSRSWNPDDAKRINAKRGTLLAKKLFDELLAAQVFLFWEGIFSGC